MSVDLPIEFDSLFEFEDPLENYDAPVYSDSLERALAEEQVGTIHCSPFARIAPQASVHQAIEKMRALKVGCLLVMEGRRLVGLFTERDVLNKVAENYRKTSLLPISALMTRNVITVDENDPTGAALCVMAGFGYRHVPVLDFEGDVVGVVSPQRMVDFLMNYLTIDCRGGS